MVTPFVPIGSACIGHAHQNYAVVNHTRGFMYDKSTPERMKFVQEHYTSDFIYSKDILPPAQQSCVQEHLYAGKPTRLFLDTIVYLYYYDDIYAEIMSQIKSIPLLKDHVAYVFDNSRVYTDHTSRRSYHVIFPDIVFENIIKMGRFVEANIKPRWCYGQHINMYAYTNKYNFAIPFSLPRLGVKQLQTLFGHHDQSEDALFPLLLKQNITANDTYTLITVPDEPDPRRMQTPWCPFVDPAELAEFYGMRTDTPEFFAKYNDRILMSQFATLHKFFAEYHYTAIISPSVKNKTQLAILHTLLQMFGFTNGIYTVHHVSAYDIFANCTRSLYEYKHMFSYKVRCQFTPTTTSAMVEAAIRSVRKRLHAIAGISLHCHSNNYNVRHYRISLPDENFLFTKTGQHADHRPAIHIGVAGK